MKLTIEIPDMKKSVEWETSIEFPMVMEAVQKQIEEGETSGSGVTEDSVRYTWEIEE